MSGSAEVYAVTQLLTTGSPCMESPSRSEGGIQITRIWAPSVGLYLL